MSKFYKEILKKEFELVVPNFIWKNGAMYPDGVNEDFVGSGNASLFPEINTEDFSGTTHKSFVYAFIFENNKIYKIGQTEKNLLTWAGGKIRRKDWGGKIYNYGPKKLLASKGIAPTKTRPNIFDTTNRIGAYFQETPSSGPCTEERSNEFLREYIEKETVSLWAIKAPMQNVVQIVGGEEVVISLSNSKLLEGVYLDKYKEMNDGELPPGNPTRG